MARNALGRHPGETPPAVFSLAVLVPYIPGETWLARSDWTSPGYVVDAILWVLFAYAGVHSLRARPRPAPGPLCGAWGFAACLAWRCYFTRVTSAEEGWGIYEGEPALVRPLLGLSLLIALPVFAWTLWLARASAAGES